MNSPLLSSTNTFTNIDVLTDQGLVKNTSITIEGNKILSIGKVNNKAKEISMPGYLVVPGMVNSHTHSPMNFLRDLCHGNKNMIEDIFFKTESQLNNSLSENLSFAYILSGLKSGVTSFVEHYYFIEGISNAFEKIGLRAFVGETLADIGGAFPSDKSLSEFKTLVNKWPYSDRISPIVCPHAADTVSPEFAKKVADFAQIENLPLHFHLAQRKSEYDTLYNKFQKTPVELANEWGWLSEKSLAVHLLHVNDNDIKILKDSGTTAVSCPSSQIIYEFLAPIDKFYNANLNLSLGTDCAASNDQANILSELKVLTLLMKDRGIEGDNLYKNLFKTVTTNPAETLDAKIGKIKPGYLADLVFVNQSLDTLPLRDIWTHMLFSYESQHIDHVMVDGKFVLFEKQLCQANESELYKKFESATDSIKF